MLQPADHHPLAPLRLAREGQLVQAEDQRAERHLGLEAGQVGPEAAVDARTELHVVGRIGPVEVDGVGVVPPGGVAVGGPHRGVDHVTGAIVVPSIVYG